MAVSDESFNVRGGHVIGGCIVHTGEELENYELNRSKDLATDIRQCLGKILQRLVVNNWLNNLPKYHSI